MYKLIHGYLGVCSDVFFEIFIDSNTRGHQYKIRKQYCSVNAFKYNFPNRCIDAWNSLPATVVNAATLHDFKRKLNNVNLIRY